MLARTIANNQTMLQVTVDTATPPQSDHELEQINQRQQQQTINSLVKGIGLLENYQHLPPKFACQCCVNYHHNDVEEDAMPAVEAANKLLPCHHAICLKCSNHTIGQHK